MDNFEIRQTPSPAEKMFSTIKKVESFADFIEAIESNSAFFRERRDFTSPQDLISKVNDVRSQTAKLDSVPTDSGIREKLNELILTETINRVASIQQLKEELGYLYKLGASVSSSEGHTYTLNDIYEAIDSLVLPMVTRNYGLRDKVKKLWNPADYALINTGEEESTV